VSRGRPPIGEHDRLLQVPLMRDGLRVPGGPGLEAARDHLRNVLRTVPWEGLKLSRGEPALPTILLEGSR
jgi:nicotinate phosphoribosyltransferase